MSSPIPLVQLALRHQQQGRLQEAESLYRQILNAEPRNAGVLHLLGLVQYQLKKYPEAIDLVRQAIKLNDHEPLFHANLGKILKDAGKFADAEKSFLASLRLNPDYADAHGNLGSLLIEDGRTEAAIPHLEKSLAVHPRANGTRLKLVTALNSASRFDEAARHALFLVQNDPNNAPAHHALADIYLKQRQYNLAIQHYQNTIELGRESAELHKNLGDAYFHLGIYSKAESAYESAMRLAPGSSGLGLQMNVGQMKIAQGLYREGMAIFDEIKDSPEFARIARSNILLSLHYSVPLDSEEIFRASCEWNERYAVPVAPKFSEHSNSPDPQRRIRIGYVSGDFRRHPVGCFLQGVIPAHSRDFEIFLYSNVKSEDQLTQWFKNLPAHWRSILKSDDDAAADLIRSDQIDILVDLSGHTAGQRLLVFAKKPAPIQVTWLGYCDTTGLTTMDYLLADSIAIPQNSAQKFTEQVYRLPGSYLCYQSLQSTSFPAPPPALAAGHITFGSFNNLCKVNEQMVDIWCAILQKMPASRLILKTKQLKDEPAHQRYLEFFLKRGIAQERVELLGDFVSAEEHFAHYGKIDIALDTFPYNGVTTTCDALWMGVPVVTLAGEQFISRNSASILTNLGLSELVANTPGQYVEIALALAQDPGRLSDLRQGIRARFAKSPLGNPPQFTKNLEAAFRSMWQQWRESRLPLQSLKTKTNCT